MNITLKCTFNDPGSRLGTSEGVVLDIVSTAGVGTYAIVMGASGKLHEKLIKDVTISDPNKVNMLCINNNYG